MKQRSWAILVGAALSASALAQEGTIDLSAFPSIGVADGRTPITITAVVRDRGGNLVPNGTQVVFDTNLGTFKENLVTTENGYARATLVASSIPGLARIRASVLRFSASNNLEFEFVSDRAMLDSARDFIEVTAPKKLVYSVSDRIIEASSAEDENVVVLYRDTTVRGKDVQLKVLTYDLKARNAVITIGGQDYQFEQLYYNLRSRRGFGIGRFKTRLPRIVQAGMLAAPIYEEREVFGPFSISAAEGVKLLEEVPDQRQLDFQNIVDSLSTVEARKAVAFPRKEVQFHQSNVKVGNLSIMKLPLFQVGTQTASPLITDQMFQVTNNQIALNYPYYLSLKPGETSLLRFRYGSRLGGTGLGASTGYFLDYELKWNRGDDMEGGFMLQGMNRTDWGASLRQYYQADPNTTISAQLDLPAHKSLFGNVNVNRLFDGFQANFNAMQGRSIGNQDRFQTDQYALVVEKDPIKVKNFIPGNLYVGMSANSNGLRGEDFSRRQESLGLQARYVSRPIRFDGRNSASFSLRLAQLSGENVKEGLSQFATVTLSSNLNSNLAMQTTYDFVDDGFNSELLGMHRLTSEAYYRSGRVNFRGYLAKALDIDRMNASASFDYQFNTVWSFYYNYFMDRYLEDSFTDQTFVLGYRIGFREIGLSYSPRTKRIGIELLGTRF